MKSRATVSIVLLFVVAIGVIALVAFRPAAVEAAYPVENAAHAVSTGLWPRVAGLFRGSAAQAENVRLKREVDALRLLRGDVERLETENAKLRRALDYMARAPEKWLAAPVLSRNGGAAVVRDTLRVGKGTLDGVRENAIVVVPEGLVGQVTAVTPHTAEVTVLADAALKVACEVGADGPSGARGILCGGSDELLVVRYLRGADRARSGARVFTSGRGGVFPRGIPVGTLLTVTNRVRGVEGEVRPAVDFATLEDVFIRRAK